MSTNRYEPEMPSPGRSGPVRLGKRLDAELTALARQAGDGSPEALADLLAQVRRHRLARRAASWLQNPADIDEVEQATLMKVERKIADYNGLGTFHGWVRMVALNEARQLRRRHNQVSSPIPHADPAVLGGGSERFSSAVANQELMEQAMDKLNVQQELVLRLRNEGYVHEEIAAMLGIAPATSRTSLHRAKVNFAKAYSALDPDRNPALTGTDEHGDENPG